MHCNKHTNLCGLQCGHIQVVGRQPNGVHSLHRVVLWRQIHERGVHNDHQPHVSGLRCGHVPRCQRDANSMQGVRCWKLPIQHCANSMHWLHDVMLCWSVFERNLHDDGHACVCRV